AVLGGQAGEGLLRTAESIGDAVAGALDTLLPCASSAADSACAGEFIDTYGKRLFRRPLEGAERERYMSLFDTALEQTDFDTAIKWVTTGLVQSPNAMYRSELGTEQGDGTRALTPYEVATQ